METLGFCLCGNKREGWRNEDDGEVATGGSVFFFFKKDEVFFIFSKLMTHFTA